MAERKRVLLALSGGVDSSVCIHLLQQSGYEVTGCVISFSPAHAGAVHSAKRVAQESGIPLHVLHCEERFRQQVILPFCREYAAGRTPNPCPVCNPLVKFQALLEEADRLGIHAIASGHYARVEEQDGIYYAARAASAERDQSYMLYRLPQAMLSRLLLPLGSMEKPAVRALAQELGLSSAESPDSQEICFIPDGDYAAYIEQQGITGAQGHFLGPNGENLGPHRGILHYTIGQRRGLGVALGKPVYVREITPGGDVLLAYNEGLFAGGAMLEDTVFTEDKPPSIEGLSVKIRSMASPSPCQIIISSHQEIALRFAMPLRAPAPGQHAVLYDGPRVIGGGVIRQAIRSFPQQTLGEH